MIIYALQDDGIGPGVLGRTTAFGEKMETTQSVDGQTPKTMAAEVFEWIKSNIASRTNVPNIPDDPEGRGCDGPNCNVWHWRWKWNRARDEQTNRTESGQFEILVIKIRIMDYGSSCETCNRYAEPHRLIQGGILVRHADQPDTSVWIDTDKHEELSEYWWL